MSERDVAILTMSESHQPSHGETASGANEVKIHITSPTPIVNNSSPMQRPGDSHNKLTQLPDVAEENRVHSPKEDYEEKQVLDGNLIRDGKEVVSPQAQIDAAEKEVYNPSEGYSDKQVFDPGSQARPRPVDPTEKEVYFSGSVVVRAENADTAEKQVYLPESPANTGEIAGVQGQEVSSPGASTETEDSTGKQRRTSLFQRQLDRINQVVDKKTKAITNLADKSNTRYARVEKGFTDRCVAIEQSANTRFTRLGKDFNDRLDRAEQNVTAQSARIKQSTSTLRLRGQPGEEKRKQSE
ncbi:hypothetical protein FZEAL_1827 [Fusarium zealandicum]|uniref:Uncharacterized protein n=1 Tax=Fusarium zealandicum TaxID=1053134 RepID=A0A8H4USH3_9HYPO|nr:hypothetical protein FZEAL_1827 [Fusarium zealandicum]